MLFKNISGTQKDSIVKTGFFNANGGIALELKDIHFENIKLTFSEAILSSQQTVLFERLVFINVLLY